VLGVCDCNNRVFEHHRNKKCILNEIMCLAPSSWLYGLARGGISNTMKIISKGSHNQDEVQIGVLLKVMCPLYSKCLWFTL